MQFLLSRPDQADGEAIFVYDLNGTDINVNTIVVSRAGADVINGGTSISIGTAYGGLTFTSDGLNKWRTATISASSGALLASNNLSDLTNVAKARTNLGLRTAAQQPATAFQRISGTTVNNANYTGVGTDRYIAQTGTLSATRNWTLPFANTVAAGEVVTVGDESGTAKTSTPIVVQPRLGNFMNGDTGGFVVLNYAYATQSFISNGSSGWYILPRTDLFFVDFTVQVLGAISNVCQFKSGTYHLEGCDGKKVSSPHRRKLIDEVIAHYQVSKKLACKIACVSRSVYYYKLIKKAEDEVIVESLKQLAQAHPHWGFRKILARLKHQGYGWNHKRVYRIYVELGVNIRLKPKKQIPSREAVFLVQPINPNVC